jgi:hypothetical protein
MLGQSTVGEIGNGDIDVDEPDAPRKDEGSIRIPRIASGRGREAKAADTARPAVHVAGIAGVGRIRIAVQ